MKNSVVRYDICYFRRSRQAAHSEVVLFPGSHANFTCAWVETTEQSTVHIFHFAHVQLPVISGKSEHTIFFANGRGRGYKALSLCPT